MCHTSSNACVGDVVLGVRLTDGIESPWSCTVRREVSLLDTDSGVMIVLVGTVRHISGSRFTPVSRSILSIGKKW